MTPRYFREGHQVGRRLVGHASVLGSRYPAAYLVKVAVASRLQAVDLQPGTAVGKPTPRAGREHVASPTERERRRDRWCPPGGTSRSRSRDRRHAHRWLVSRPSGAATTPEISARRSSIVRMTTFSRHCHRHDRDDLPAGCPDHAGSTCRRPRARLWSPSPAAFVAGGGEPAGVQILPIRVPFEAIEIRCCAT